MLSALQRTGQQRWNSFVKQWRSGKLIRISVVVVGLVWYASLVYYYLRHIKWSKGASVNQPLPNVFHLSSGILFGAILALCVVLISGATGAFFRWPATVLMVPLYIMILGSKLTVANSDLRVTQGAARQWLVHGVWLGTASAPFVLVVFWVTSELGRNQIVRRLIERANAWRQRAMQSTTEERAVSEESRPLVTSAVDEEAAADGDAADGGARRSGLVILDRNGEETSASALLAHSTRGAGAGGWMNRTCMGRLWRRHGTLFVMAVLLFFDLWLSVYPARVQSVSGDYTTYTSFYGLSMVDTVQCATTHTAATTAEWMLKDYSSSNSAPWDGKKPNVLWVLHDDLRAIWGKPYMQTHTLTPNIDDLSDSSFVFDQAYCQIAVCGPSRSSVLTGRRPDVIRSYSFKTNFRGASFGLDGKAVENERGTGQWVKTLPQLFKEHGYITTGSGKVFHQGEPAMGDPISWSCEMGYLDHGQQKCLPLGTASNADMATLLKEHKIETDHYCTEGSDGTVLVDDQATRRVFNAIDQAVRLKRPFFTVAGLRGMHGDYAAPQEYLERYFKASSLTPFDETEFWERIDSVATMPIDAPSLADNLFDWSVANHTNYNLTAIWRLYYRATVSYADELVGRMLDKLEEHDLTASTIVILSADHGVHLGEQGMTGKNTNYESATKVPILIRAPMLRTLDSIHRVGGFAENVDIYPTLAAIAGLEYDHNSVDGHSLVPAMKHSEDTKGYALSQYMRCADDGNWVCTQSLDSQITQMGYSIRVSGWRYTEWFNWNHPSSVADWEHPLAKELYRYAMDSTVSFGDYNDFESVNLLGAPTAAVLEKASELAAKLRTHFKNFTVVL